MNEIGIADKETLDQVKASTDTVEITTNTIKSNVDTVKTNVDAVSAKSGTNTDASGTTTIFSRLRQIYEYLTTYLSSTRVAKIDNLDATVGSRQANWGATTTHRDRIDTTISSRAAQTTADAISTVVNRIEADTTAFQASLGTNASTSNAVGDVHAKLKDLKVTLSEQANVFNYPYTKTLSTFSGTVSLGINASLTIVEIVGEGILELLTVATNVQPLRTRSISVEIDGVLRVRVTTNSIVPISYVTMDSYSNLLMGSSSLYTKFPIVQGGFGVTSLDNCVFLKNSEYTNGVISETQKATAACFLLPIKFNSRVKLYVSNSSGFSIDTMSTYATIQYRYK